jgi:hypothetical protein
MGERTKKVAFMERDKNISLWLDRLSTSAQGRARTVHDKRSGFSLSACKFLRIASRRILFLYSVSKYRRL